MFRIILLIYFFGFTRLMTAQELMTIGKEKVSVEEFLRIYQKNNQSASSFSEKDINEYLDLFTLFKMKLQEARRLRLDTLPALKEDYQKYTEQLVQNHFVDKNYMENIWKAQYEHMKYDVKVAHIMVKCAPNALPADTLIAYNKLNYLRQQANKDNFSKLATENSEDPSSAPKGGLLGYITAFMTFPEFEVPCFATPVGGISPIFRTQYGYHILHVLDKRTARGRIKVAHIFLKKSDKNEEAEKKIQEAYKLVSTKKISFEDAVSKYSEDASTKETKGELQEFGVSEMVIDFEEQCFALKNPGDISKPFMTDYGWHMVKLIEKKPLKDYEGSKETIIQRMARDPRVNYLKDVAYRRMIEKYKLSETPQTLANFSNPLIDTFFMVKNWVLKPSKTMETTPLFTFGGKIFTLKEFTDFANQNYKTASSRTKKEALDVMYNAYKEKMIWETTKTKLSEEDKQFGHLEAEYMNGLLIFEIMDKEVWKKAVADTIGSKKLYEEVKNNYWFKDRVFIEGIKMTKPDLLQNYTNRLSTTSAKILFESIKKSKDSNDIVYYEKTIEKGEYTEVDNAIDSKTMVFQYIEDDKSTVLAKIVKNIPPSVKPYADIKGRIQNLYQNKLEKEWGSNLRAKYPVKLNQSELNKLIKK
ncbi:MAG: peptidylprolyl isomerase [Chitinophagales bacterium]|nr:peptidylprolyl isomerase [Chitinophagales bacterium]